MFPAYASEYAKDECWRTTPSTSAEDGSGRLSCSYGSFRSVKKLTEEEDRRRRIRELRETEEAKKKREKRRKEERKRQALSRHSIKVSVFMLLFSAVGKRKPMLHLFFVTPFSFLKFCVTDRISFHGMAVTKL